MQYLVAATLFSVSYAAIVFDPLPDDQMFNNMYQTTCGGTISGVIGMVGTCGYFHLQSSSSGHSGVELVDNNNGENNGLYWYAVQHIPAGFEFRDYNDNPFAMSGGDSAYFIVGSIDAGDEYTFEVECDSETEAVNPLRRWFQRSILRPRIGGGGGSSDDEDSSEDEDSSDEDSSEDEDSGEGLLLSFPDITGDGSKYIRIEYRTFFTAIALVATLVVGVLLGYVYSHWTGKKSEYSKVAHFTEYSTSTATGCDTCKPVVDDVAVDVHQPINEDQVFI